MVPQYLPKGRMHEMSYAVMLPDSHQSSHVDKCLHGSISFGRQSVYHVYGMARAFDRVQDANLLFTHDKDPGIPYLTAGFGIKGRPVQHNFESSLVALSRSPRRANPGISNGLSSVPNELSISI